MNSSKSNQQLSFDALLQQEIQQSVQHALYEDLGGQLTSKGDITALLIPAESQICADLITREKCVFVGASWVQEVFQQIDPLVHIEWQAKDGDVLAANDLICTLTGNARSILTGERTAMNFIQTLSGTATKVAEYVNCLKHSKTELLDTRKTIPGLRFAQKHAVKCGGGRNHRIGLFDAFLIKENHIMACGSIPAAVQAARSLHPEKPVEVEVESLNELQTALNSGADIIMLDNFSLAEMSRAVELNQGKAKLEVSGNITKAQLSSLADIGVDYISSGAITKHITAVDLSLRVRKK